MAMLNIQKNSSHKGRFSPPRMLLILAQGKEAPEVAWCGFWVFLKLSYISPFIGLSAVLAPLSYNSNCILPSPVRVQ